jgi:PIF1-like helicase
LKSDVAANADNQLLFFMSGEGGTGKSEVVRILRDAAKVIFGMKGPMEPMVSITPTGSSAFSVGGYTWHNILGGPLKGQLRTVTAEKLKSMADKLRGTSVINFDEVSMLGCNQLADINLILKQVRGAIAAANDDERTRRAILETRPFGGFHMLFTGDFYQFPPVMNKPLYTQATNLVGKDAEGRRYWTNVVRNFQELTENFRALRGPDGATPVLARFLQGARIGEPDPGLLNEINVRCVQYGNSTQRIDPRALWMAPSRDEVERYNEEAFDRLQASGNATYRAVAKHIPSTLNTGKILTSAERACADEALFKYTHKSGDSNDLCGELPPGGRFTVCASFLIFFTNIRVVHWMLLSNRHFVHCRPTCAYSAESGHCSRHLPRSTRYNRIIRV